MSARPTVLVVSNHGEIVGGGEISLLTLLGGLDRSRWKPVLVVPGDGEMAARGRSLGVAVEVVPLPSLRRPTLDVLRGYTALRRLVHSRGANLLHANGSRAMLYAGPVGRITGRPVIWHVRIAEPEPFLDRALLWLADAVVVNSGAVARRFSWAPAEKIHCIHNGVDFRQFSPRPPSASLRTSLGIPEQAPVVGSVGRFVPFKGYPVLLQAARTVGGRPPGSPLAVGRRRRAKERAGGSMSRPGAELVGCASRGGVTMYRRFSRSVRCLCCPRWPSISAGY